MPEVAVSDVIGPLIVDALGLKGRWVTVLDIQLQMRKPIAVTLRLELTVDEVRAVGAAFAAQPSLSEDSVRA